MDMPAILYSKKRLLLSTLPCLKLYTFRRYGYYLIPILIGMYPVGNGIAKTGAAPTAPAQQASRELNNIENEMVVRLTRAAPLANPVLSADAIQPAYPGTTRPYCTIVQGSGKTSYISAVINDPADPAATEGIYFTVTGSNALVTATSSDTNVVKLAGVNITQNGTSCVVTIRPNGIGYTTIGLRASSTEGNSSIYKINYAASASASIPANTVFATGMADASAASVIDSNFMLVADDEDNVIRLFHRGYSGQALYSLDISNAAGATEECDLEASATSVRYNTGRRIYWIGSLGNSKSGNLKPSRNKVIATSIIGEGSNTIVNVTAFSNQFRNALVNWGNTNGWNFSASSASGMIPKRIDGFNVEGLAITHGGDTCYIAFRAPCVPRKSVTPTGTNREYALLAPVTNFETIMNGSGQVSTTPSIGEPILFDLGGLGIRSIEKLPGGGYIIVAGLYTGGGIPVVYFWDGGLPPNPGYTVINANSPFAQFTRLQLPGLEQLAQVSPDGQAEGHPEALIAGMQQDTLLLSLISDNGTVDYYNDGNEAKDLDRDEFKKFRSDFFRLPKDSIYNPTINLCPGMVGTMLSANRQAASYQWQIDSCETRDCFSSITDDTNFTGATSKILVVQGMSSRWNGYQFRCIADGVNGTTYRIKYVLTWTGAVSNAWELPGNWDCLSLPDEYTDIMITSGAPVLNSNATIRSLFTNKCNLTITPGKALRIKK